MLRLLKNETFKLWRSPMTILGVAGGSIGALLNFFLALNFMRQGRVFGWESHLRQTLLFYGLLGGTLLVGFAATYLFVREVSSDTLKNLLVTPFPRWMVFVAKMLVLFLWVALVTGVSYAATVAAGVILSMDGFSGQLLLDFAVGWSYVGLSLYAGSAIAVTVALLSRAYPVPIGYLILASIVGVFTINWDMNYLVPWSATIRLTDLFGSVASETTQGAALTLCLVFVVFNTFNLLYFSTSDVH